MNQFFINGFRLETESLNALNDAYYETDDRLKRSKCQTAKITTKAALRRLQGDYFHYQVCYKDHFATDYSYFFESLIDTSMDYSLIFDIILYVSFVIAIVTYLIYENN